MTKRIYDVLKENGIDVFFPSQHKGDCISPYVVIREGTENQFMDFSTNQKMYDIFVVVPENRYSYVSEYMEAVRKAMSKLWPAVRTTNVVSEIVWDELANGWTQYEQYTIYKRWKARR